MIGRRCGNTTKRRRAQGINGIAKLRKRSAVRRMAISLSASIVPERRGDFARKDPVEG